MSHAERLQVLDRPGKRVEPSDESVHVGHGPYRLRVEEPLVSGPVPLSEPLRSHVGGLQTCQYEGLEVVGEVPFPAVQLEVRIEQRRRMEFQAVEELRGASAVIESTMHLGGESGHQGFCGLDLPGFHRSGTLVE